MLTSALTIMKGVANLDQESVVVMTTVITVLISQISKYDIIKVGVVIILVTHTILTMITIEYIQMVKKIIIDRLTTDDHITCNHMTITLHLAVIVIPVDTIHTNDTTMDGDNPFYYNYNIVCLSPLAHTHTLSLYSVFNFYLLVSSFILPHGHLLLIMACIITCIIIGALNTCNTTLNKLLIGRSY